MSQSVIELDAVSKYFGDQVVLSNVSMSVKEGDIVGLLGPNGSGKTTMIRLMNGVINQTAGKLSILGMDPGIEGDTVRKDTGILTENAGLYHEMSGLDNLIFFSKLYGQFDLKQIHLYIEEFELTQHMHKKVGAYSTGMKRRLGIIKAILHKPRLLFLDEPTNGLDPEGIKLVLKFLKDLNEKEGTTIFLCSHILHQLEHVCKEYFFLNDGKISDYGTINQLQKKYVRQIKLKVFTNLMPTEPIWEGYPVLVKDYHTLQFVLPSSEHITPLLQKIISKFWVHHVEIENNDLESLYFKIRSGVNE
ncbi:ABC transporter ATP-binding protein [Mesobacillus subterraneus]|uniref:ABC transporter ATP-binding protein n=1 Tax=Mesobacillus subterraneus TaxID=285983 RepID=UPI001CFD13FA|nr:ABC transporter ATP-binding protein [Mesobacillus subterraneus]WLR56970.1 ABC transporter ATP-binding protein [Mesobacillus subterraneus]